MARTLSISGGTIGTVDLIGGVFHFSDGSWSAKTADAAVWETLDLFSAAADASSRAELQRMEGLFALARRYRDNPVENTPVWFTWASEGETAKRSLVMDGMIEIRQSPYVGPMLGRKHALIRLAIQRQACFEATTPTLYNPGQLSATGGMTVLASTGGVIDGRIASLALSSSSVAAGLSRVWAGLRPVRSGGSHFTPVWECERGTLNVGNSGTDTTQVTDAAASGGKYTLTNFNNTPEGNYWRVSMRLSDIAAGYYPDYIGRYLVLGRLRVDAPTTQVAVQLRHGWLGFSTASVVGTTFISGQTNWKLVELGQIQLPPTSYRDGAPTIGNGLSDYGVQIFAERLSVAGNLQLDCLILIPCETLFVADGASIDNSGGQLAAYSGSQDGDNYAVASQPNNYIGNIAYSFTDWAMPYDGALLVVAAQNPSFHAITPVLQPILNVYPRWRGLR